MRTTETASRALEMVRKEQFAILEKIGSDPQIAHDLQERILELGERAKSLVNELEKLKKRKRGNALTDTKIKALKPREKAYYEADGQGLSIYVKPNGSKTWRFRYRLNDRSKTYTIGSYPETGLATARAETLRLRELVEKGVDPVEERRAGIEERRRQEQQQRHRLEHTFEKAARHYIRELEKQVERKELSQTHLTRTAGLLENFTFPGDSESKLKGRQHPIDKLGFPRDRTIGPLPLDEVDGDQHLQPLFKAMMDAGMRDSARKLRQAIGAVYRNAAQSRWIPGGMDPTQTKLIKELLRKSKTESRTQKHHAHISTKKDLRKLLVAVEGYRGDPHTRLGLLFTLHTALRSGTVRHAEWSWVDWEERLLLVPAERMKSGRPFRVPLTDRSIAILEKAWETSGRGRYIFPSQRGDRPMSENALMVALKIMGFSSEEITVHGMRGTFSTFAHDHGQNHYIVELALDHTLDDETAAAYNHSDALEPRRKLAEWWSDFVCEVYHVKL